MSLDGIHCGSTLKMSSRYGANHGLPGYDEFRTGLTFSQVKDMMKDNSDDPKNWRYKRRGTVLGFWHQLKRDMYEEACRRGYLTSERVRAA